MQEKLVQSVVLGISGVCAAWLLGHEIASIRTADRTVQVKGAAEMPVVADLATWNLGLSATGDDLGAVQRELAANLVRVQAFLVKYGVPLEDISYQALAVNDAAANQYNNRMGPRFTVTGGVTARTEKLDAVQAAKNALGELVGAGVILSNSFGPNYTFTRLNAEKPKLVAQATQEARKAAEQFARDSGANVGGMRRAQQGSVQILGRDSFMGEPEQPHKILRVVTTVDYDIN